MSEETKYPSDRAMRAAVIMEIHAATSTQTVAKGRALDELFPAYEDMLAALKAVVGALSGRVHSHAALHAIARSEEAIAKAEGRDP